MSPDADGDVLELALDDGSLSAFNAATREPNGKQVGSLDGVSHILLANRPAIVQVQPSKPNAGKHRQRTNDTVSQTRGRDRRDFVCLFMNLIPCARNVYRLTRHQKPRADLPVCRAGSRAERVYHSLIGSVLPLYNNSCLCIRPRNSQSLFGPMSSYPWTK